MALGSDVAASRAAGDPGQAADGQAPAVPQAPEELIEIQERGGALADLGFVGELGTIEDFGGALGAHHGDLGRGPGVVDVSADVF